MRLPFHQIDAFASRPFTGNPAAVMPLDAWLDDATLQAIAAENNLAETAFIVPTPSDEAAHQGDAAADYELRWFTPRVEVTLCGHATLASGHFVLSANPARAAVTFATRKSGVLTVTRDVDGYALDLPTMPTEPQKVPGLAAALGAEPAEVRTRGSDYIVAVFETAAQVRALKPDFRAVAALQSGDVLCIATAPGEGDPSGVDVVSRAFAPGAGIDEDPVTGSAHAIIASYWAARLGRDRFTAWQASTRGGQLGCHLTNGRVVLSGTCCTVIEAVFILGQASASKLSLEPSPLPNPLP